jgi:hypothetical protein
MHVATSLVAVLRILARRWERRAAGIGVKPITRIYDPMYSRSDYIL